MIKKIIFISLLCIVISCAFSTRGGMSTTKSTVSYKALNQDTVIKYVERPPLTKEQQARRDSALRDYIGSIMQPYADDLKSSNSRNITSLTEFIQSQGNRLDSVSDLRFKEVNSLQLASAQRDSFLIQSILKDKRIDSLQVAVLRMERTNIDANRIVDGMTDLNSLVRDLALYIIIALGTVFISLTLFLEWLKSKKRKEFKFIKQDE